MLTIQQMVDREVNCCLSHLVSTLANGYGSTMPDNTAGDNLGELVEQAFDLASPVADYEEAWLGQTDCGFDAEANHDGEWPWFKRVDGEGGSAVQRHGQWRVYYETAIEACNENGVEPYEREVYEHWSVSNWLAEKLTAHGEKVDTDFADMSVWARTCTGQGIASDGVIERIYAAMMNPEGWREVDGVKLPPINWGTKA